MRALLSKGLKEIATELALKSLPLAGHITYFSKKLGNNYPGQVGVIVHYRLQDRIPSEALSETQTSSGYIQAGGGKMHVDRDSKHARQT